MAKRPPKNSPKWWKEIKCDPLWAKLVKTRDNWQCQVCGRAKPQYQVHAHHLIHKDRVFFRHILDNGICLCARCHTLSSDFSAHGAPWAFESWMIENRPDQYQWWSKNRYEVITGMTINYEEVFSVLKEQE